ncbi:MAG: hypothetical protein JNJ61_20505 [Anaerolineae bacterium]|nr:hypothetical protein [Anaerolineae bacterium]
MSYTGMPLLCTKITLPVPRAEIVNRARLLDTTALPARLLLVSAPAGFGKSTFLVEYCRHLASSGVAVSWYALDDADNDLARFSAYMLAAMAQFPEMADLADTHAKSHSGTEAIFNRLINHLASSTRRFLMVLDDYHLIKSLPVHSAVNFLLEHLPDNAQIAIGSRADPPLQLSRLRVRQQMIEIRAADLRFTTPEITAFCRQVLHFTPSQRSAELLEDCTEGWAAALQLAALSLGSASSDSSIQSLIARFSGNQRHLFDYLADEVFEQQPPDVQNFLLATSVLDRLHDALCGALTGSEGGSALLRQLDRANLFVVPLDEERNWYRYHHLFAEFLRARLEREQPGGSADLHRRASLWYQEQGYISEAVEHALASGALEYAADLMQRYAETVYTELGAISTLLNWYERLSLTLLYERPALAMYFSQSLFFSARREEGYELLRVVESWLARAPTDHPQARSLRLLIAYHRGLQMITQSRAAEALPFVQEAQRLLCPDEMLSNTRVEFALGNCMKLMGQWREAAIHLEKCVMLSQVVSNKLLLWEGMCDLVGVLMPLGQLRRAYRAALKLIESHPHIPTTSDTLFAVAHILYEWNELERAEAFVRQGLKLAAQYNIDYGSWIGYSVLWKIYRIRGQYDAAEQAIDQITAIAEKYANPRPLGIAGALQARGWLADGDTTSALHWADTFAGSQPSYNTDMETLTQVLVLLHAQQEGRALGLIDELIEQQASNNGVLIELLALRALASDSCGRTDVALRTLNNALQLAEAEGYIRTFIDLGAGMLRLLRRARGQQNHHAYIERILAAAPPEAAHSHDGLTEREQEVLCLLASGASNQDIAERLVITVGTAKTHISHLMSKLDARNRTEVVAHARTAGLLHE